MNYEDYKKNVGKQVAELRKESGLTQRELAEKSGVNHSNIAKIESGTYNCSIFILEKIAKCLNATIELKKKETERIYIVRWSWQDGGSVRKDLSIEAEYASFTSLEKAIEFAEKEIAIEKEYKNIASISEFEAAMKQKVYNAEENDEWYYGATELSNEDIRQMGGYLDVTECVKDENGEIEIVDDRWSSELCIIRGYGYEDCKFFDEVMGQ